MILSDNLNFNFNLNLNLSDIITPKWDALFNCEWQRCALKFFAQTVNRLRAYQGAVM